MLIDSLLHRQHQNTICQNLFLHLGRASENLERVLPNPGTNDIILVSTMCHPGVLPLKRHAAPAAGALTQGWEHG